MKNFFSLLSAICCCAILFFSCQKDFSIENGKTQIASGSLTDSFDNCLPNTVIGTFYNGVTPGGDTAYVQIQVNVSQTGSYSIYTDFVDGFKFGDSGIFTNTGINTVRLKPIGTPIIQGSQIFNVSFDSSSCSFIVNIQDSTGTGLGGTDTTGNGDPDTTGLKEWQFTEGSFTYAGRIDSAAKDNSSGLATYLSLNGSTTATGDTTISIKFLIPASDIQTGTYTLISNGISFTVTDASTLTVLYSADGLTAGTDLTINVTSYNVTTKVMQGDFSGNVQDKSGNIVPITKGSFTATVQ